MAIYDKYAPFYDGSGQIRFAVLTSQYLSEVLERHRIEGSNVLDLACGTGTLACILADAGWDVIGLDQSEAMLALARERISEELTGQLRFIKGDLRTLPTSYEACQAQWPELADIWSFDLITCCYDSLNYLLSEADLARCFAGVAWALAPGGLFYADMNTRYFLEYDWPAAEVLERSGFVQVSQSWFDTTNDCSTMVLTGFVGNDAQGYRRFDEIHIERAYPAERVAALLENAGLVLEATYDCFTFQPVHDRTQRIAWIARKPVVEHPHSASHAIACA